MSSETITITALDVYLDDICDILTEVQEILFSIILKKLDDIYDILTTEDILKNKSLLTQITVFELELFILLLQYLNQITAFGLDLFRLLLQYFYQLFRLLLQYFDQITAFGLDLFRLLLQYFDQLKVVFTPVQIIKGVFMSLPKIFFLAHVIYVIVLQYFTLFYFSNYFYFFSFNKFL